MLIISLLEHIVITAGIHCILKFRCLKDEMELKVNIYNSLTQTLFLIIYFQNIW